MAEGKTVTTDHPVAYVSGLFRGSQLNWAALTKEAFTIYMSVKKLSFYLTDADVLLKSDHLPLKKFLLQCGISPFKFKSFPNKFRIWNNSSSCFMCNTSKIY